MCERDTPYLQQQQQQKHRVRKASDYGKGKKPRTSRQNGTKNGEKCVYVSVITASKLVMLFVFVTGPRAHTKVIYLLVICGLEKSPTIPQKKPLNGNAQCFSYECAQFTNLHFNWLKKSLLCARHACTLLDNRA